ncbi:hypothetical protein JCM8097_005971 [Rhodosporidiobolus ruineniae]
MSRRRSANSLSAQEALVDVEFTIKEGCEVQVLPSRPILRIRRGPPPSVLPSDSSSRLSTPLASSAGRPQPKRAMTRMVPVEKTYEPNENPLEQSGFREGLLLAGYVAPIDTSRKAIKGRFQHGLEKQEFKAHLDAFLEEKNLKPLGAYMIRFQGPTAEAHSPFVHLFTTTLPSDTSTSQIFADGPDVQKPEISTTWTCLPAESSAQQCTFACKAKRFWPVRVVLELSSGSSTAEPAQPAPPVDDRSRRRKRRDTFQSEVDLEDEIKKQEEREAKELKVNTELNSLRPADLAQLKVDTSAKPPPPSSPPSKRDRRKKERRAEPEEQEDEVLSPLTPTILESAKQLGQSIVATVQPVVQTRLDGLKQWWAHREQQQVGEEDDLFDAEEEERERRRRRRERRERRKAREAREAQEREDRVETAEVNRMADEEEELERAARRKRRAERRARREAEQAASV